MKRALLAVALLMVPSVALAMEERCTELGANCICSEPMQGTMVVDGAHFLNPSDSTVTTKQCALNEENSPIRVPNHSGDYSAASDSGILALLPSAHTITQYLKSDSGITGGYEIGHQFDFSNADCTGSDNPRDCCTGSGTGTCSADPVAQVNIRFYRYYSSDVQITGDGSCTNGKIGRLADNNYSDPLIIDHQNDSVQLYGMINWDGAGGVDCCNHGPNVGAGIGDNDSWKGKWWRFELIYTQRAAGPTEVVLYRKRITTANTDAEEIVIDSRTGDNTTGPTEWTNSQADDLIPPRNMNWLTVDAYREGTCAGYIAHTNVLVAAWSTVDYTNHRIGAAVEVEGDGGAATSGNASGAKLRGAKLPMIAAILLAVVCTPDLAFTPTPVLLHDPNTEPDLAGYSLYRREPAGQPVKVIDLPCWIDQDGTQVCRGVDVGIPVQRYCPTCVPLNWSELAVKAFDTSGNESAQFSNWVSVCPSPICTPPGPCD